MDAGALDVLHNAGDQHVLPVGDDVHLQLHAGHIFVDQHGVVDAAGEDARHIAHNVGLFVGDGHVLAADDIAGAQQHRVAQRFGRVLSFLHGAHAHALRAADGELLQQRVEPLAILRHVDALRRRAEDAHALLVKESGQLDGRLAAERHNHAHRLFHLDDAHDVLFGQRLEVQPVGGIIVG